MPHASISSGPAGATGTPGTPTTPARDVPAVTPATTTAARRLKIAAADCCGGGCASQPAPRAAPRPPSQVDGHDHPQGSDHAHGDHGHGHGHAHAHAHADDHDHGDAGDPHAGHDHSGLPGWPRLGAALVLATAAELLHFLAPDTQAWRIAGMAAALVAIGLAGLGIYRSGIASLFRGRLGINALMSVAVTGAFLIGQWPEAAMVMALYALAELIEERATDRASNAIGGLLALAPAEADVRQPDGTWATVAAPQVALDAVVRVRPGALVPLDGIVAEGASAVDQSSVTGESLPVEKAAGDRVFAGTINTTGELQVRVTSVSGDTTLDRIIRAVEQAQAQRAPTQRLVERFAAVYTPGVFALALAVAVGAPMLFDWSWLDAIYKALVLLVIACPCAFVISTPVTVVSGLTAAARRGILVKGGSFLETARGLKVVALDKTGTLTAGKPALVAWQAWNGTAEAEVRRAAAALAERSDHPVSLAIATGLAAGVTPAAAASEPAVAAVVAATDPSATISIVGPTATPAEVTGFKALAGRGAEGVVDGEPMVLGNRRLIEERGQGDAALAAALAAHEAQGRTVTLLAGPGGVRALFAVADTLRPGAPAAVARLRALGIATVMLTGDNAATARAVAAQAGITDARGDLLPEDKLDAVRQLQTTHGLTGMAGDGINDAPALAQADIGFAMGAAGTDIAMETADIVVMNDDLQRIAETVELSRRTHAVLWQNITIALGIKAVFFALALAGQANMWMAVFADMGASLLVVANGLRLLRTRQPRQPREAEATASRPAPMPDSPVTSR